MMARKSKVQTTITPPSGVYASAEYDGAASRLDELRKANREIQRKTKECIAARSKEPEVSWEGDAPAPGTETPKPPDINELQMQARDIQRNLVYQEQRCLDLGRQQARQVTSAARPRWLADQQQFADMLIAIAQHCDAMHARRAGLLDDCSNRAAADPIISSVLPLPGVTELSLSNNNNRMSSWLDALERLGCEVPATRGITGGIA